MDVRQTTWAARLTFVSYSLCALVGMGWHDLLGCHHGHAEAGCHAHASHGCNDSHAHHDSPHDQSQGEHSATESSVTSSNWSAPDDCPICRYQSQAQSQSFALAALVGEPLVAEVLFSLTLPASHDDAQAYLARGPPESV